MANRFVVVNVWGGEVLGSLCDTPLYRGFDPAMPALQHVDYHCVVLGSDGPLARASLWWRNVPPMIGERLGVIGHYTALDDAAAQMLLTHVLLELRRQDCTLAVGPMDGNTWRRYRFVTDAGSEKPFLLEPENPPSFPAQWSEAGFKPLAQYSSALTTDLTQRDDRVPRTQLRMQGAGVRLRMLDSDHFEQDLQAIYAVSEQSFQNNFLYTPLPQKEFLQQYRKLQPMLRPELVWIAEVAGAPVGYAFGLPDLSQAQRGEPVDTVIIKTVAVLPARSYAGLGAVLVAQVQAAALDLGFNRAIHALMHESNNSRNLSSVYASPMRGYTLYGHKLAP